ncbi:MAG: sulfotransferase domain-containing protein [Cyanobacteriota bacterium]|nr:sulfotransferase domain-containing protein [Cyanobacteriota bacterium]
MKKPNFIVVGAHKAGTTSLHHYLAQHPDIALIPNKGSDLLARRKFATIAEAQEYLAQFDGADETQTLGEVSSVYLHRDGVAQRIKTLFPDIQIIAVLRNPMERAFSHALWKRHYTVEELKKIDEIILNSENFLLPGLYGKHIQTYLSYFNKEQIKLMEFQEFKRNSDVFWAELCKFIGVDSDFIPNAETQYHHGALKINNIYSRLLGKGATPNQFLKILIPKPVRSWVRKRLASKTYVPKMKMSAELRAKLKEYYYEDIMNLQKLTGLDYSHWLDN